MKNVRKWPDPAQVCAEVHSILPHMPSWIVDMKDCFVFDRALIQSIKAERLVQKTGDLFEPLTAGFCTRA